jgi:hypothetical protein
VGQLTPDCSSKRCPDCGNDKPLDEFVTDRRRRDGRGTYCRLCFAVRYRQHRERKAAKIGRTVTPKRVTPEGQKWCPTCAAFKPTEQFPRNRANPDGLGAYCKPCHNAKGKATYERLYGSTREYHLRRRYGITGADFDAMVEAQGGTCAVCHGKPEHVDHDHATGKVRGILCFNCNQALGNVRDDVDVLQGLIDYLHRNRRSRLGLVHEASAIEGLFVEVVTRRRSA